MPGVDATAAKPKISASRKSLIFTKHILPWSIWPCQTQQPLIVCMKRALQAQVLLAKIRSHGDIILVSQ